MDAFFSLPSLTKLDCESTISICPGTVFTVRTVLSGILGGRVCRISQYSGYQDVMSNVHLSVFSTLMDRLNQVLSLDILSCFPCCTLNSLFITTYQVAHVIKKTEFQCLSLLIIIQYCIHFTELHTHTHTHTHFGVAGIAQSV